MLQISKMQRSCLLVFKTNPEEDDDDCEMVLELIEDIGPDQPLDVVLKNTDVVSVEVPSFAAKKMKTTAQEVLGLSCVRLSPDLFRGDANVVGLQIIACAGLFRSAVHATVDGYLFDSCRAYFEHFEDVCYDKFFEEDGKRLTTKRKRQTTD